MSTTSSPSPSPSSPSSSDYYDDSSELDELEYRSRKLTDILRKNMRKADKRRSVLDTVRQRAWLLDDQAKLLEKQTKSVVLRRTRGRRALIVLGVISSFIFVGVTINRIFQQDE